MRRFNLRVPLLIPYLGLVAFARLGLHFLKVNWQYSDGIDWNFLPLGNIIDDNVNLSYTPPPQFDTEMSRDIFLMHVGKAGGSSIRRTLGLEPCREVWNASRVDAPLLSRSIKGCHHIFVELHNLTKATSFMFPLRDPIARIVSAFNFHHVLNSKLDKKIAERDKNNRDYRANFDFYHCCFPTVEDLALAVGNSPRYQVIENDRNHVTSDYCRELGRQVLAGRGDLIYERRGWINLHLGFNYEFYAQKSIYTCRTKEVLAIRCDNVLEDLTRLDRWIGGDGVIPQKHAHFTHGSENYIVKSGVSVEGARLLCCVLHRELAVYQDLVNFATNLHEVEKDRFLETSYRKCSIPKEEVVDRTIFSWSDWWERSCRNTSATGTLHSVRDGWSSHGNYSSS